jgi:hypothetical protein
MPVPTSSGILNASEWASFVAASARSLHDAITASVPREPTDSFAPAPRHSAMARGEAQPPTRRQWCPSRGRSPIASELPPRCAAHCLTAMWISSPTHAANAVSLIHYATEFSAVPAAFAAQRRTRARKPPGATGRPSASEGVKRRPALLTSLTRPLQSRNGDAEDATRPGREDFWSVAYSAVSARLSLFAQSSHAIVVAPIGVNRHRALLCDPHGHVGQRRALPSLAREARMGRSQN